MKFQKENIIDNWLDKNSNPKINLYIKFKIMAENLKYSFSNNWKLYTILTILGLILIGFLGGCPSEEIPATVENSESSINESFIEIGRLESLNIEKEAEILALQNQLHKISVDFMNYKKTPKYKERIAEIIATVPIDTLASNRIELEICKIENLTKDTIIQKYAFKSSVFDLQKMEYQSIIDNQNEIIDIHVREILNEQKLTKKEKRAKTLWKITTAVIGGAYIYKTVK
jgi:hypothetical protein